MRRVQINITTHLFREMDVLLAARELLHHLERPRILSFGCSIGDELASLRALFPQADIHGCDINPEVLALASATTGHLAEVFLSSEAEILRRGPFDLVCAFSSLCLNPLPKPEVMAKNFPFAQFQELTELLTQVLAPGGLLALKNTSYLLCETAGYPAFDICRVDATYQNGYVPVLRKDQSLALSIVNTVAWPIHRQENLDGLSDWDLVDSLFRKRGAAGPQTVIPVSAGFISLDEGSVEVARWSRSNFDLLKEGTEAAGLIELRHDFTAFSHPDRPRRIVLDQVTHRQPIAGGPLRRTAFHRSLTEG